MHIFQCMCHVICVLCGLACSDLGDGHREHVESLEASYSCGDYPG
jgi:hypothetical protein